MLKSLYSHADLCDDYWMTSLPWRHRVIVLQLLSLWRLAVYRLPVDLLINLGGPPGQLTSG